MTDARDKYRWCPRCRCHFAGRFHRRCLLRGLAGPLLVAVVYAVTAAMVMWAVHTPPVEAYDPSFCNVKCENNSINLDECNNCVESTNSDGECGNLHAVQSSAECFSQHCIWDRAHPHGCASDCPTCTCPNGSTPPGCPYPS